MNKVKEDNQSDSSFEEENSIFSRPLKDLPVLSSMNFVYDLTEPQIDNSRATESWEKDDS